MCGISGFNFKDERKIREMIAATHYRGPDADGLFVEEGVSLGHNRLSVIDLSTLANQPMFDTSNELVIVFNGEIYNFQDIKSELEGEYKFKTKSDTEVILAGYRKWGKGVFSRLNGMYGLAIWDKRNETLVCARDHMGMKPLYYFWDGSKFIFASELRAIFTHEVPRELNVESFNHFIRVNYVPEPMTLVKNIFKLPPAHCLTLRGDSLSIEGYIDKDIERFEGSYGEAREKLRNTVLGAVERHLTADVPVGVYLSGGIDSSTVLYAMSEVRKNIETFTIGFSLEDKGEEPKFNHDFYLAEKTAKHFGTNHNPIVISSEDAVDVFDEVATHNSDPVSNPTSIAMFLLARHAKSKVTVALTGNAGDELLGGYERYRYALEAYYYRKLPNFLRSLGDKHKQIRKLNLGDLDLYAQFMFEKDPKIKRVVSENMFKDSSEIKKYYGERYISKFPGDSAEKLLNTDQRSWLVDHFFMLTDKMSMASALEERMPLADMELVDFARSLPREYKVSLFQTKKILKDAFRDSLPEDLFHQPKRGWFSPAAKWLREPGFRKLAEEILREDYYRGTKDLFNWSEISVMLSKHIDKSEYNLTLIWAILTFQVWAKKYQIEL